MTSSSGDEKPSEMKEMMDKFNKYAKQVKLVLTKLEEIDKKIDNVVSAKTVSSEEEKENLIKYLKQNK